MTTHTGSAQAGSSLAVRPLAGALGATVDGVDLAVELADPTVAELQGLLDEHLVLFFPAQPDGGGVDDEQQYRFATRFGSPYAHPIGRMLGRTAADVRVEHIVDSVEHPPYQDKWHTDVSWDPQRPVYGTLRACVLPSRGGDTIWSSMYAAYESLSPLLRERIDGLVAVHDMGSMQAFVDKAGAEIVARTREAFPGAEHPVVGVHARTGRRFLNVNREFTDHIVGLHPDESRMLLDLLCAHAEHPNVQLRHSWKVGEVAIWDEYATQHFAVADYLPESRDMARVAVGALPTESRSL
jgi:taurine dioxygenase